MLGPTKRQLNFGFNSFQTLLICGKKKKRERKETDNKIGYYLTTLDFSSNFRILKTTTQIF